MNWSRGLLRAWMVFTVVWFIGMGAATYDQWPKRKWWESSPLAQSTRSTTLHGPWEKYAPSQHKLVPVEGDPFSKEGARPMTDAEIDAEYSKSVRENLLMGVAMASGLPAVLFLLGWTILWVGRGFRKT